MRVDELGEFGLIEMMVEQLDTCRDDVVVGPGDDTAVVRTDNGTVLLITADTLIETVHFSSSQMSARDVGWKSLAVNLSDIAAMGGSARWATVSLRVPQSIDAEWCRDMYHGVQACAGRYGVIVIGGNVTKSVSGGVSVDVTVVGVADDGRYVLRGGAEPGDIILVTGPTGLAAAGRGCLDRDMSDKPFATPLLSAFTRPKPRLDVGKKLAADPNVTAMIDISDGLVADLNHICESSGVRADINASNIPVTDELKSYCDAADENPLHFALTGGEDYELVVCCRPDRVGQLNDQIGTVPIGVIKQGSGVVVADDTGRQIKLDTLGWNHLSA